MTLTPLRPRYAGLDGLRAIAVTLVILYHLFPQSWFHAGYVGVDVFFVISGFLITSLLLRERETTGRIRLGRFWSRRARRLLPALALMVTVCATAAWLVGGDVLVDLGRQVAGAATFSYNWLAITAGGDYFAAGGSELFRNLWSLAVEEQFYLVWPLLLPLILRVPSRVAREGMVLVAAAASAGWMLALTLSGGGLTRAYFGTDSHAFGLLLGVALSFALHPLLTEPPAWMHRRTVRAATAGVGTAALAALLTVSTLRGAGNAAVPGALLAASLLSALVVAAGVWPGSPLGRALDIAPLRLVGERSYALYLWHWPILVLLTAAVSGIGATVAVPTWLGLTALLLTLIAAETSLRFVEAPVRRGGFRRVTARMWVALGRSARGRFRVIGVTAVSLVLLGGTTAAIAAAPEVSSGEAAVDAGVDALKAQPDATATAMPTDAPSGRANVAATTEPAPTADPVVTAPEPVRGDQITAVGDSVMLASAPVLLERFPGIQVDAAVSRSMYAAPGILRSLKDAGQLRPNVVLALGTNGAISPDTLAEVHDILGSGHRLVLVTASAPRSWIDGVNAELNAYAQAHRDVQVADWAGAISGHLDLLAGDQVHPGRAGGEIFADAVAQAFQRAQESDAQRDEIVQRLTDPLPATE